MSTESAAADVEPKSVLVVDDVEAIRTFVCTLLIRSGLNVISAATGEEALQASRNHKEPLDLLISNVQMPGISGIELGAKINQERPETRVLLMSGLESGMLILNEGWHFLPKPFVASQLLGIVTTILASPPSPDFHER